MKFSQTPKCSNVLYNYEITYIYKLAKFIKPMRPKLTNYFNAIIFFLNSITYEFDAGDYLHFYTTMYTVVKQ